MLPPPVSPCVPRVGKGQVLLQAISSAPSSYKPCTVWCVNCTDAQLPTVFTRRHCCSTAFKASLPMAFSMRALHCSSAEQLSRGRADICEGGVWFRRCLSRLGFPHGELRTCHQTHPHHNGLPVRSAAFHWAGAYSHYSLGLCCHTHLLQLLPHNIARKIPSIASAIQYDGAQYVCNNASMRMELLGKLQWFGHRRCLPHTSSVIG